MLPRSFFSADHHDNTRSGKAIGFKLTAIWDMIDVKPLFRIPTGVLFAKKTNKTKRSLPVTGLDGISFTGNLPAHNCNLPTAEAKLAQEQVKWFYSRQGKGSAFSNQKSKGNSSPNPYKNLFKKGAELTPRGFYFVQLSQEEPPDYIDRIINIKTADASQTDAKAPWKGFDFNGKIESQFLFRTALSKSILPFQLYKPELVVLPITINNNKYGQKEIQLHSVNELMKEGFLNASKWFQAVENIWSIHRTEKNKSISAIDYVNWHNKLITQNLNFRYLVLYNASAKNANSTIVYRTKIDFNFFVDHKTYVFYTNEEEEAYYLTAILNSNIPNEMMKDFQTKGLFGARDVHKKILDIYYPKFNATNETHQKLAVLSQAAHAKAAQYIKDNSPKQELTAMYLGRLRMAIKKHLTKEMQEIDELVEEIIV